MTDILVIGDCTLDQHLQINNRGQEINDQICFTHGSKVGVNEYYQTPGGNAFHVGVSTSRLGLQSSIMGLLGDDTFGTTIKRTLVEEQVDVKDLEIIKGMHTNTSVILTNSVDRTIFSYHNEWEYKFNKPHHLPKWVYYTSMGAGFIDFQPHLLEWAAQNNIPLVFNPGTQQLKHHEELIQAVRESFVLFVNLEEANKILNSDESNIEKLHGDLYKLGPAITVITQGSSGASAYDGQKVIRQDKIDLGKKVDVTGAGDSFASGFISALHHKKSIKEALVWGSLNAGNIIKHKGVLEGLLSLDEMQKLVPKYL